MSCKDCSASQYSNVMIIIKGIHRLVRDSTDCVLQCLHDIRDVDNSRKPGKLPGCERDFSGCKALLLSPKCF